MYILVCERYLIFLCSNGLRTVWTFLNSQCGNPMKLIAFIGMLPSISLMFLSIIVVSASVCGVIGL